MASRMQGIMLQLPFFEASHLIHKNSGPILNWKHKPSFSGPTSECGTASTSLGRSFRWRRRHNWKIAFALDTGGGIADNGGSQESMNDDGGGGGERTPRLGRLVSAGGRELLLKLNSARKNFPMKVFLLLLGFYTANALATILGQTGDWDVLVAGVVVAAIEGIGILMYRRKPKLPPLSSSSSSSSTTTTTGGGRFQSLVVMVNYWKAGLCLGLFVDAFKLGS
ncbi:hypothetical protein LguiA_022079 [Lonicera macranthoides]